MTYQILCRVSCGVTGDWQSWLKNSRGEVMTFRVKIEAEAAAKRCRGRLGLKHGPATFEYTVVEVK